MQSARTTLLRLTVVLACCAIGAGLYGWWRSGHGVSAPSVATATPSSKRGGQGRPVRRHGPETSPVTRSDGWARKDLYDSYEHAKHLGEVFDKIKAEADAGDPYAKGLYAQMLLECSPLVITPYFLEDQKTYNQLRKKNGRPPIPDALVQRFTDRCQELVASGKVSIAEIRTSRQDAASNGDPLSVAIQFTEIAASIKPEERQEEVSAIVQTRNPYAIFVLADLMSQQGYGKFSGDIVDEYAWKFVACDLGMDCSGTGAFVVRSCLVLSACGIGDYKNVAQNSALTPEQFERVLLTEREILSALEAGDYDGISTARQ